MMKKELNQDEMLAIANELKLFSYIDVCQLIDSLNQHIRTKVTLVCTDRRVLETILRENFRLSATVNPETEIRITAAYGDPSYSALTEYGEVLLDDAGLARVLACDTPKAQCSLTLREPYLKNLTFEILYIKELGMLDNDSWRYLLLDADMLLFIMNSDHVLYTAEKEFVTQLMLPFYSPYRLLFGIGGAEHLSSAEWEPTLQRVALMTGDKFTVFPLFTENVSEQRRKRFSNSDKTIASLLSDVQHNAIEIRAAHAKDIEDYKLKLLEDLLKEARSDIEKKLQDSRSQKETAALNKDLIETSRKHIEDNIDLFLKTPMVSEIHDNTKSFAKALTVSLHEDIDSSEDIEKDARSIARYLNAVWQRYAGSLNTQIVKVFEKEARYLFDMMRLDLNRVTRNIHNATLADDIRRKMDLSLNINSFFASKATAGESLSDSINIGGGLLIAIGGDPAGLAAIVISEVMKALGANGQKARYKEVLKERTAGLIEKNADSFIAETSRRLPAAISAFHKEIMASYDNLVASIDKIIKEEHQSLAKGAEHIEMINNLI